ncbi:uncharacterized protein LOC144631202 [Oculina patagonica]
MRLRDKRRCYLFIAFVFVIIALYFLYFKDDTSSESQRHFDANTFRYQKYLQNSSVIVGKIFNFDSTTLNTAKEILNTQTFRSEPVIMESYASVPRVVPITAASSNHFNESLIHIKTTIPRFFPDVKLVFFDLGLANHQVEILKNLNFVDYRKFDFARFPRHVGELYTYAWKVLIIQEMLAEFGAIMWLDASIQLVDDFRPAIKQMLRGKSGFLFIVSPGQNSILAATHLNMLEYFPMIYQNAIMQQACAIMIVNTPEVQRDIMKWAVLCALEMSCIAPLGSIICPTVSARAQHNVGCHRFDQAMFNVLVSNAYKSQRQRYVIQPEIKFAQVKRLKKLSKDKETKRIADQKSLAAYNKTIRGLR